MAQVENQAKYRLGLDMGTNSIGWAAIELDENGAPSGILDMGVRIFPDGRNPRDEASNAVQRRVARGQRRRRDRYIKRRKDLINALVEYGLMPKGKDERKRIADDAEHFDPYDLRARALDLPLKPFELGRALFHLDQRRGFKSNRKLDSGNEDEAKKTRADISELGRRIEESGARTLGEYLARRRKKGKAVRARPDRGLYPDRAMYEREFDKIREAQKPHQNLTDEQWDNLCQIIFFQRPLKPVDPGWCLFEDGEPRAPRALPIFQEFRMLQEVNNLKIQVGTEDRALNPGERERALRRLRSGSNIDLERPVKALELQPGAKFNLAAGGRKAVKGDETAAKLAASPKRATKTRTAQPGMFGDRWLQLSLTERNRIVKFLLNTEDPEVVRHRAVQDWGLNEEQAAAVFNVSLVSGYGNLSEKAIRKILPHLERGLGYSDAVLAAGYPHHSDFRNPEAHESLPYYGEVLTRDAVGADPEKDPKEDGEPVRYGRIANPTVHIGLGQLRRVVNRLIEVYGKPEDIVVEIARYLKMNREQKIEYQRRQREGGERNNRFAEMLKGAEVSVNAEILRKLRLWEEQGQPQNRVCPYTGRQISFEMAVSAQTEIDHILPFSRSLDNSMNNLVVCLAEANRAKGDNTPHEAFGQSPPGYDYDDILHNAPPNKRWRFQPDAMEQFESKRDFLDRQLTETQYLSRTARTYLAYLYDEKSEGSQRVRAIPGKMTALLRRGWGLNGMLSESGEDRTERKQRDDHRHHAIDAFVVANTTQGLLQQFARAAGSSWEDAAENLARLVPDPWNGFDQNDLKPFLDKLVVSYKPDIGTRGVKGKTTGQLHNHTAYGLIELSESGTSTVVVRKKLSDVKKRSDLESVRDPALRDALKQLWDDVGNNPAEFSKRAEHEGVPLNGRIQKVRRVRTIDRRQDIVPIKDSAGREYKGYRTGGNSFADVWQMGDRGRSWKIIAVPTFHANQREFNIEDFRPTTSRGRHRGKPDPNAKHLMRLHKDDMGALGEGDNLRLVRVRKFGYGYVVLDDHIENDVDGRERLKDGDPRKIERNNGHSGSTLRVQGFRQIRVDEIGCVYDPGTFPS